ncbi:MAG TPA: hypothetical protein VNO55_31215, partial [Polyangia bacterium]|nr:hypothetical protein [Polyangia bacterium]
DVSVWRGFLLTSLAVSLFFLCCVEVLNSPGEGHRFMTFASVLFPLMTVYLASRFVVSRPLVTWSVVTLAVPAICSFVWAVAFPLGGFVPSRYAPGLHSMNCRERVNARLLERARPVYITPSLAFIYSGCRPTLIPGSAGASNSVDVGQPVSGPGALKALRTRFVTPGTPLTFICDTTKAGAADAICIAAQRQAHCEPAGLNVVECLSTQ